jgi:hypothetical protein
MSKCHVLVLALFVFVAQAEPGLPGASVDPALRGSVKEESIGNEAVPTQVAQETGAEAQDEVGTVQKETAEGAEDEEVPLNSEEVVQDVANISHAGTNFIYCRFGTVCRGRWTWFGRVRRCSGGFVCAGR